MVLTISKYLDASIFNKYSAVALKATEAQDEESLRNKTTRLQPYMSCAVRLEVQICNDNGGERGGEGGKTQMQEVLTTG